MRVPKRLRFSHRDWTMVSLGAFLAVASFYAGVQIHHRQLPLKPESSTITSPWIPSTVKHWHIPIEANAKKYRIDPNVLAIIMTLESGGYPHADSGQAQGLMQITPLTAQEIAAKHLKKPIQKYDIWDPNTNIEFGAAYLAFLRDTFGSYQQAPSWDTTVELLAAGYNGGPGAADSIVQGKGLHDTQTVIYSRDAFNMWRERHAASSPTFDRWKERGGSDLLEAARKASP